MMGVSMAAATSDTWSSEIGIYFKGKTFDIFKMRPVPPGVSGGMSRYGTLAGILGSAFITKIFPIMALLPKKMKSGISHFIPAKKLTHQPIPMAVNAAD